MTTILIIDDNEDVANLFVSLLTDAGYEVAQSATAYDGLVCAAEKAPDLILVDIVLKETNGIVAALALRGMGITVPIMIVTGGAIPVDPKLYELAGIAGQLQKPVGSRELLAEISNQLKESDDGQPNEID